MQLSEVRPIIGQALALLPARMNTQQAVVQMLAIGLQESRFEHRKQIGGPAVGYWQFEQQGGIRGVLNHALTRKLAQDVCRQRDTPASPSAVYAALEHDDVLAAVFARLLLWTDPKPLPAVGDAAGAWDLYLRTWRPGRPHPDTWPMLYAKALVAGA